MIAPADLDRFRADLARLEATGRLAIAVSGGADSMALLTLAYAALPGQIVAATVDHRLRVAAADEAAMVAAYCAALAVPHTILTPEAPIAGASIQAQAREARYALLARWARDAGALALLTAHHADDQAETFLMRAVRGSGAAGLAGVRARATIAGFPVLRPLLGWRRDDLRRIATDAGVPFVDDPSNADARHDRTRFRALLAETPALDPIALARSAAALAEAEAALVFVTDRLWAERTRDPTPHRHAGLDPVSGAADGDLRGSGYRVEPGMTAKGAAEESPLTLDVSDLPRELRRRLARRAIGETRARHAITVPEWSDAANIEPLLDSLAAGTSATQAGVMLTPHGEIWTVTKAPPRRSA